MDIHGYIHGYIHVWILDLGYIMDTYMDISTFFNSTSFNLNYHITNFEYKLIPLAIQFSLGT